MFDKQKEQIKKTYNEYHIESKLTTANKLKILGFRIIPIVITVFLTLIGLNGITPYSLKWIALVILGVVLVIFSILNIWYDLINNDVIDDLYTLQQKEKYYRNTIEYLKDISLNIFKDAAFVGQLLWAIGTFSNFLRQDEATRRSNLRKTIEKIVLQLKDTLEYTNDSGELISIAIYIHNPNTNMLIDYLSKKSFLMKKGKSGRSWHVNSESHLAHTFRSGEGRVIFDIRDFYPGVAAPLEYDDDLYRASVTHPLTFFNDNFTVRGVFCVTSNQEGAFSCENDFDDEKMEIRRLLAIKANTIILFGMVINLLLDITFPEANDRLIDEVVQRENVNN